MIFNYTCCWRNLLMTAPIKLYLNQRACRMNGMKLSMIYSNYSTDNEDAVQYLVQLSGCTKKKAESLCKNRSLNIEDIKSSYEFLNKVGEIQNLSKYLRVLITHPMTLENHYMILEEIGIRKSRLNLKSIKRFYPILNSSQSRLKELGYLDEDANVMQNCLSHAELPDNVEMNILQDKTGEKLQSKDVMVAIIHRCVMSLLLRNKLQNSSTNDFSVHKRLNFKSLRYISSSYDILTRRFGIPVQKVLNDTALLCASPSNMEAIIDGIPTLGGIETKEIVKIFPKIVFNDYSSLIRINECLEKYNISPETVLETPMVFTLRPENVEERLLTFKTNPDLNMWSFHPQMLRTVLYQRKVLKRVDKLKESNLKCSSLFLLQCNESNFNKRKEGLDKTSGADVVWLLRKRLDEVSVDADAIRSKLKRHPHWLYVPLTNIKATLDFLLERKFTKQEIYKSLLILLYPRNIVEQELDKLSSQDGIECCKQGNELRQETILPLTLYFIELRHHFSPEAIWSYGKSVDYEKQTEATNDNRYQYIMTNT
ncbi:transcription termination factor 5, mitochondrial [Nilaparvata lugens]|uniref:transcription termination factor 5, mitochondrial n=1 Tax=Nilaparvata lugens TaxID=108931 RepID=UPI00193DF09E|nr:transcription termination factor 5, mitochondrial [Nilaparvata lugens]